MQLLVVGSIMQRKNQLGLLKALIPLMSDFPSLEVHFCGRISYRKYYSEILGLAESNNIASRVWFHGSQTREQIYARLSECYMFVLPSFQETAPIAIMEAMAAAVPVIASNVGGIPYIIEDMQDGILTNPNEVSDMTEKIRYMLSNPEIAAQLGRNAKKRMEAECSQARVAELTVKAYEKMLA